METASKDSEQAGSRTAWLFALLRAVVYTFVAVSITSKTVQALASGQIKVPFTSVTWSLVQTPTKFVAASIVLCLVAACCVFTAFEYWKEVRGKRQAN